MASSVWSGASLNADTVLLEKRALSTIFIGVTPNATTPDPSSIIGIPPVYFAETVWQPVCRAPGDLGPIPRHLLTQ